MTSRHPDLERVLRSLYYLARREEDPEKRALLWQLIERQKYGISNADDLIAEAKMIGVRNPAFEGDMIGWLDDDFDWDELDEERKKRKKK
jgi:hypothetical protein